MSSRLLSCPDGSVLALHQHHQHQHQLQQQHQQTVSGAEFERCSWAVKVDQTSTQQHLQPPPDVISLQYMELEEFLLENAAATGVGQQQQQQIQQDRESKGKGRTALITEQFVSEFDC
jgi:hypothetical protein